MDESLWIILLVIVGVGALVLGYFAIQALKGNVTTLADLVKTGIRNLAAVTGPALVEVETAIGSAFDVVTSVGNDIIDAVAAGVVAVSDVILILGQDVVQLLSIVFSTIVNLLQDFALLVRNFFDNAIQPMFDEIKFIADAIQAVINALNFT